MDENKIKAYKYLLVVAINNGRAYRRLKSQISNERVQAFGNLCYIFHNLVKFNYNDNWAEFNESYLWERYDFEKEKFPSEYFYDLRKIFDEKLMELENVY